ncbi:methionine--tRNA ligase [Mycoplasma parvum]|uniref:methionine--tRNA ligase n=1 Tax=Mycoplasma parvum str. Indiana TaxID=1403316 RepID=U5NFC9_9MOLU|nr:methionine--tRNA ligase [Mycoplasma parvum]AGX88844.1 methionyl-tRNA synthetase [Mycoplasma parvum str. Indiana]
MSENVLITTPLFYASGDPHIGHAYTLIIGDLIKKYYELINKKASLLVGVDEHGEKIEIKAKENGLKVEEFVEKNSLKFKNLSSALEINPDYFIRTTNELHKEYARETFKNLLKQSKIYKKEWTGYKCINCETNYSNKYYSNNSKCELGHDLIQRAEESFFFKITEFIEWLKNHYKNNKDVIFPSRYLKDLNEGFLPSLEDLSITRSNLNWGIKLNEFPSFTLYVWFEALLGYISSQNIRENYWLNSSNSKIIQIIGKEIFRFHAIYFPIITSLQKLKTPNKLLIHGWLLNDNRKISKSDPNSKSIPSLASLIEKYNLESIKWYFLSLNWEEDHPFSEDLLKQSYNKYLVNLLGNLINRFKGIISKQEYQTSSINAVFENEEIKKEIQKGSEILNKLGNLVNNIKIFELINQIKELLHSANYLLNYLEPWKLSLDDKNFKEINVFLYRQLSLIFFVLSPIFTKKKLEEIKASLSINSINHENYLNFFNNIKNFEIIKFNDSTNIFEKYK